MATSSSSSATSSPMSGTSISSEFGPLFNFQDTLNGGYLTDPVVDSCGCTWQRESIVAWINQPRDNYSPGCGPCPNTKRTIRISALVPNLIIQSLCTSLRKHEIDITELDPIGELRKIREKYHNLLVSGTTQRLRLQKDLKKLQEERDQFQKERGTLQKAHEELQSARTELQSWRSLSDYAHDQLMRTRESLLAETNQFRKDREASKNWIEALISNNHAIQSDNRELSKENTLIRNMMNEKNKLWVVTHSKTAAKEERLNHQIAVLQKLLRQAQQENRELRRRSQQLTAKLRDRSFSKKQPTTLRSDSSSSGSSTLVRYTPSTSASSCNTAAGPMPFLRLAQFVTPMSKTIHITLNPTALQGMPAKQLYSLIDLLRPHFPPTMRQHLFSFYRRNFRLALPSPSVAELRSLNRASSSMSLLPLTHTATTLPSITEADSHTVLVAEPRRIPIPESSSSSRLPPAKKIDFALLSHPRAKSNQNL